MRVSVDLPSYGPDATALLAHVRADGYGNRRTIVLYGDKSTFDAAEPLPLRVVWITRHGAGEYRSIVNNFFE